MPQNRHRRRRSTDVDDVALPMSTMSVLRGGASFQLSPEGRRKGRWKKGKKKHRSVEERERCYGVEGVVFTPC